MIDLMEGLKEKIISKMNPSCLVWAIGSGAI